jgi:hypothetical protein
MDGVGGSRRGATRHRRRSVSQWVAAAAGVFTFSSQVFILERERERERERRSGRITGQAHGHACWVVREADGGVGMR